MRKSLLIAGALSLPIVLGTAACQTDDVIANILNAKGAVTDSVMDATVKGARLYCGNYMQDQRMAFREEFSQEAGPDGPRLEIWCPGDQ